MKRHRSETYEGQQAGTDIGGHAIDSAVDRDVAVRDFAAWLRPGEVDQLLRHALQCGTTNVNRIRRVLAIEQHNAHGWSDLPAELLSLIFGYLPALSDLKACSETCSSWNDVVLSTLTSIPAVVREWRLPAAIGKCPRLNVLACRDCLDIALELLPRLASLVELDIQVCFGVFPVHLQLPLVTRLSLSHARFESRAIDLPGFPALRRLDITRCKTLTVANPLTDDPGASSCDVEFGPLPRRLEALSLRFLDRTAVHCAFRDCVSRLTYLAVESTRLSDWRPVFSLSALCALRLRATELCENPCVFYSLRHLTHLDVGDRIGCRWFYCLDCAFFCPPSVIEIHAVIRGLDAIRNPGKLTSLRILNLGSDSLAPADSLAPDLDVGRLLLPFKSVTVLRLTLDDVRYTELWTIEALQRFMSLPCLANFILKIEPVFNDRPEKELIVAAERFADEARRLLPHVVVELSY